jgi:apolipoprotein N-acyltransferase
VRGLALPRHDWRLIAGGALLLPAAYPPFHLILPSFVCLVPAVWLILAGAEDARPLRRHLVQGFWFGLLSSALVLYWMSFTLWRFSQLAALGYLVTLLVLASLTASAFALTGWLARRSGVGILIVFPVLWTATEWTVGHLPQVGFPWLGLGTSLTGYPVLVQIADVGGARGVTLLLALANTALALAWLERGRPRRASMLAGGVAAGVLLALGYGAVRASTLELRPAGRIAVLQPNAGWAEKWEEGQQDSIVEIALNLAARALYETKPDLVVWPETAVPGYFHNHPVWRHRIAELSRAARIPQVVGGYHAVFDDDGGYDTYNAAFLFDTLGFSDSQPVYHKQYLVPITERVPFVSPRWFSGRFFGGFGRGGPGPVYRAGPGTFGVLICYESAFEDLARDYRRRGAEFLVNITNDAWFGRSSAVYQHASHLVMRAIENRAGIGVRGSSGAATPQDGPFGPHHGGTPAADHRRHHSLHAGRGLGGDPRARARSGSGGCRLAACARARISLGPARRPFLPRTA